MRPCRTRFILRGARLLHGRWLEGTPPAPQWMPSRGSKVSITRPRFCAGRSAQTAEPAADHHGGQRRNARCLPLATQIFASSARPSESRSSMRRNPGMPSGPGYRPSVCQARCLLPASPAARRTRGRKTDHATSCLSGLGFECVTQTAPKRPGRLSHRQSRRGAFTTVERTGARAGPSAHGHRVTAIPLRVVRVHATRQNITGTPAVFQRLDHGPARAMNPHPRRA